MRAAYEVPHPHTSMNIAQQAASNAQALARATLIPWMVGLQTTKPAGQHGGRMLCDRVFCKLQGMCDPPDPLAFVPEGEALARADVYPATRFDDLRDLEARRLYESHYRAYLTWRSLHAGITPDGVSVMYRADQWCRDGRP